MSSNPYQSPEGAASSALPPRKTGTRGWLVTFFVAAGIIGILFALLIPSPRIAREAARRAHCSLNLRNIALALQQYESTYHALPPACTVDASGRPLHSWRTLILPYLDQHVLYDKIDLSKPWDDPANKTAFETRVPTYTCPSSSAPAKHTKYLAVVGPNGCLLPTAPRQRSAITDDGALTLMVVEVGEDRAVHWMSPTDASEQVLLDPATFANVVHPGTFNAAFLDGRVQSINSKIDPNTLRAMISIAGQDDKAAAEAAQ